MPYILVIQLSTVNYYHIHACCIYRILHDGFIAHVYSSLPPLLCLFHLSRIFVGDQLVFNYSCGHFFPYNSANTFNEGRRCYQNKQNHSISLPLNNWCATSPVENTPSVLNIDHLIFAHKPPDFNPIDAKLARIHIARDFLSQNPLEFFRMNISIWIYDVGETGHW